MCNYDGHDQLDEPMALLVGRHFTVEFFLILLFSMFMANEIWYGMVRNGLVTTLKWHVSDTRRTLNVCLKQAVDTGQLAEVHGGEPRESKAAARVLDETARRHGRADEGVRDGHVEPVQLRQQRVQRSRPAEQGRQLQTARSPAEGAESLWSS